ncbi:glycerate kinase [Tersicoccus sp. Bi-70]|uniref:glycerate kinase n=1 Tax=Tersicoccus sp. Bi-70 TaxID=1897634 RepID=UPI000975F819|nr:glycerate kinase [Tersicoccus sp. Bi-70]OMH34334.1 glycerate kinase [Tersicoccus sp. Bi-70]
MAHPPAPIHTATGPRIVIASDKFKGSATADEVGAALASGILAVRADATVEVVPVADGGEGTLDAALAGGFGRRDVTVHGPTGKPLTAAFGLRGDEAFVEMAAASGLAVLPEGLPAPLTASSRGTGDLIRAALDAGARRVVLGVGGSASTDGGAGMLTALGVRLLDAAGRDLPDGGGALERLDRVDVSGLDPRLPDVDVVLASDVENPLLGARGAAAVFGPQKGASAEGVRRLEVGLHWYAELLGVALGAAGTRPADRAGAGAAGGVGFAALAALRARRRAGADLVMELVGLPARIAGADLVITGEGSLDEQSLAGKTPMGVLAAGQRAGVAVVAVAGRSLLTPEQVRRAGFRAVHTLAELEPDPDRSMRGATALLRLIGERIGTGLHDPEGRSRGVVRPVPAPRA